MRCKKNSMAGRLLRRFFRALSATAFMFLIPLTGQAEVFGDWKVDCQEKKCQAVQQLFVGEGEERSRVLSASVVSIQAQPVLQLVLPLGVDLRPGVVVRVDQADERHFAYSTCLKDGCVALIPLEQGLLQAMKAGSVMKAGFRPFSSEQTLVVELSLSGFTKASAKVQ